MDPTYSTVNLYNVLEIPQNADSSSIKAARNRIARKVHSDKGGDDEMMKVINKAFEVLSNPLKRREYDAIRKDSNESEDSFGIEISGSLPGGKKLSDDYLTKINLWKSNYNSYTYHGEKRFEPVKGEVKSFDMKNTAAFLAYKNLLNRQVPSILESVTELLPAEIRNWSFSRISLLKKTIINSSLWTADLPVIKPLVLVSTKKCISEINNIENLFTGKSFNWIFPEIRSLKQFIQEYSQSKPTSFFSEASLLPPGKRIDLCPNTNFWKTELGYIPFYTVSRAPAPLEVDAANCADCNKSFGLFLWASNCKNCGNAECNDCLTLKMHPDYSEPVQICDSCKPAVNNKFSLSWIKPLEDKNERKNVSSKYLALLDEMGYATRNDFIKWSAQFLAEGRYDLAIQCNFSANGDWNQLTIKFIEKKLYAEAKTCLNYIKQPPQWWKEKGVAMATLNPTLALLCFLKANIQLQPEKFIDVFKNFNNSDLLIKSYILLLVKSRKQDIVNPILNSIWQDAIYSENDELAIFFTNNGNIELDKWINAINSVNIDQAKRLIQYTNELFIFDWHKICLKSDRDHLRWKFLGNPEFDTWLTYLVKLLETDSGAHSIPYFRSEMLNENFMVHRDAYLEKREYNKMLICHRLIKNGISWEELAQKWCKISGSASLAALLCTTQDMTKNGDQMYAKGLKSLALRCYLQERNYKAINEKANSAENNISLLYKFWYWKGHPQDLDMVLKICNALIMEPASAPIIQNLMIATTQVFRARGLEKANIFCAPTQIPNVANSLGLHLLMLVKTNISDSELLGIIESYTYVPRHWLINEWYDKALSSFQIKFKNLLRTAIHQYSFKKLIPLLDLFQNITKPAVNELLQEFKLDQQPKGTVKSMCLLIKVLSNLHCLSNEQLYGVMNDITEAILGDPNEECRNFGAIVVEKIVTLTSGNNWKLRNQEIANLQNPLKNEFTERLAPITELRILKRSENAIGKFKPLDAAMSYIDLCMAIPFTSGVVGNFLNAAMALVKLLEDTKLKENEKYAYRRAIVELVTTTYSLGNSRFCPATQLYVLRSGIAILTKIYKQSPAVSQSDQMILEIMYEDMDKLAKVAPLMMGNILQVYDTVYLDLIYNNFMGIYLDKMRNVDNQKDPIYQYYMLEGSWKGWISKEKFSFEEERKRTMQALLKQKGETMSDVEALMNWPAISRDSDGWLLDKPTPLNLVGEEKFSNVEGIRFNMETGEISFLLEGTNNPMDALFDTYDVADIMKLGVGGAEFTLDPPDDSLPSHPFQEMKYAPSALSRSNYLATMLHADMLLKMLSMNTEICSIAPFPLRDAANLLNRMPLPLRKKFTKLHMKLSKSADKINRFWIQAGDLIYFKTTKGNVVTYTFGESKMFVKKHRMTRDRTGKLVDTDKDDDTTSPEAKFAKLMSDKYDILGDYFPELARLKQLVKLQAMSNIARNIYENRKIQIANFHVPKDDIQKDLNYICQQIDYPQTRKYEDIVQSILRKSNLRSCEVPEYELDQLKNNVWDQCIIADIECINQVIARLSKFYHAQGIDGEVKYWINNKSEANTNDLISTLMYSEERYYKKKLSKICNTFVKAGIATELPSTKIKDVCTWVPAAFRKIANYSVYGGVNMNARMIPGGAAERSWGVNSLPPSRGGPIGPGSCIGYQHVVGVDSSGRIYGTTVGVDRVTGNTYRVLDLRSSVQDEWSKSLPRPPQVAALWKTYVGYTTTEHYTAHVSGSFHVHNTSGFANCTNNQGNSTTYKSRDKKHRCS